MRALDLQGGSIDMKTTTEVRWMIIRDLGVFHIKLWADGLKNLLLAPVSLAAAVLDLLFPGHTPGRRFYSVMGLGERFDHWLSLFAASREASVHDEGLFGASRAGSPSFLGKLEEAVLGYEEPIETS